MKPTEMWALYQQTNPDARSYEAWAFAGGGQLGDELAELVLRGLKTATASAHVIYEIEKTPVPAVGALSLILRSDGEAVCIIRTTDIHICRFDEVSADHAFREGEDDRSLESWRREHRKFFSRELAEHGLEFKEDMMVVCESFVVEFV
jgi:uncharacterized protein YhfF